MIKKITLIGLIICISFAANAQTNNIPKGWHLLDYSHDSVYGISLQKAYDFLSEKNKKSVPVIVAVIDGGIDTAHPDLKNVLWTNPHEIADNNIDDDGNGYIDDIHGWNFLGNKDGSCLKKASDEKTRVYYKFKTQYATTQLDTSTMNANDKYEYNTWQRAANEMKSNGDDEMELNFLDIILKSLKRNDSILCQEMCVKEFSIDQLENYQPKNNQSKDAKFAFLTSMRLMEKEGDDKNDAVINELDNYVSGKKESLDAKTNAPKDYRAYIIKDNYNNIQDKFYGNNNVKGPDAMHGTHVAGIIAAQRNNGIGIDGVADNVKVMAIRAVPDGDEYDKDVALSIFYAVNNGAKVINMSFGKAYSPEKKWVDSAIEYARQKDVLIIHAAGNEATDIDVKENFPSPYFLSTATKASNFITVGASGDEKLKGTMAADFSNFGKQNVDVFAPGVKIYSTIPENQYGNLNGTSMAAPIVTGLAALIREYYPELTAQQVKEIIETSVSIPDSSLVTIKPGTKNDTIPFSSLSKTGGIVNAYNAVKAAYTLEQTIVNKEEENKTHLKKIKKH